MYTLAFLSLLIAVPGALRAPAPEPALEIRFGTITLPNGVRLHYAEQGDPDGTPIVFLHGYGDSWFSFSRLLPLLPARYRALALDLRGHGDSDRPAEGYRVRDLADDVSAFLAVMDLDGAVLVGHSMGTFVAQQVALATPERLAGIVLLDGARSMRRLQGIEGLAAAVAALPEPVPDDFVREFQLSTVHHPVPAGFMEDVIAESRKLSARVWQALMDGMLDAPEATEGALGDIPALLIWGEQDALFSRAEQGALLAILGRGELRVYPETGHAPHWERPEDTARDLAAFGDAVARR
jgi:pimeloyl-ACP methyl ester carboxylesterase